MNIVTHRSFSQGLTVELNDFRADGLILLPPHLAPIGPPISEDEDDMEQAANYHSSDSANSMDGEELDDHAKLRTNMIPLPPMHWTPKESFAGCMLLLRQGPGHCTCRTSCTVSILSPRLKVSQYLDSCDPRAGRADLMGGS